MTRKTHVLCDHQVTFSSDDGDVWTLRNIGSLKMDEDGFLHINATHQYLNGDSHTPHKMKIPLFDYLGMMIDFIGGRPFNQDIRKWIVK